MREDDAANLLSVARAPLSFRWLTLDGEPDDSLAFFRNFSAAVEGPGFSKSLAFLIDQRGRDMTGAEKLCAGEFASRLKAAQPEEILCEREMEVLRHLAAGASNKEIGGWLFISLSTVKTHVISIYSKLRASSRVRAVEKARSAGLIQ